MLVTLPVGGFGYPTLVNFIAVTRVKDKPANTNQNHILLLPDSARKDNIL